MTDRRIGGCQGGWTTSGTTCAEYLLGVALKICFAPCRTVWAAYLEGLDAEWSEVVRSVLPVGVYSSMDATCNAWAPMEFPVLRRWSGASTFPLLPSGRSRWPSPRWNSLMIGIFDSRDSRGTQVRFSRSRALAWLCRLAGIWRLSNNLRPATRRSRHDH